MDVRFCRFLQAALFMAAILALQPVVWLPSMIVTESRFRDHPALNDLRPGPLAILEAGDLIGTAPDWVQSTGNDSRRHQPGSLVLAGLPPGTRVFANGILLTADRSDQGNLQFVSIPPDYLHDGNNRFDVIHQRRVALGTPYIALTRAGNAVWRAQAYARLAEAARLFVGILSLLLAAIHLGRFARRPGRRDLGFGVLCLGIGLAGSPQIMVAATHLPEIVGVGVRWLAVIPAIVMLPILQNRAASSEPAGIAASLCFAFAFAVPVSASLGSSLSPWPAIFDGMAAGLAIALLALIGLARLNDAVHSIAGLVRRIRQRNSIISYQEGVIAQQARTLEMETRKRAVLEERARIARDMHDGLGGNLLSLLVEVRSGNASRERIESALEDNLDDMRLMIDSLDHADRSLATALSTFQTRIRPMFEASGIALHWTQPTRTQLPTLSPEAVLNLLRVLQEAASNIVRHSGADEAAYVIEVPPEGGVLRITVSDNGSEVAVQPIRTDRPTSGLRNMAKRVEALKGQLSAGYEAGTGWVIRVSVPF
jgi:signal transduction histidine kinase